MTISHRKLAYVGLGGVVLGIAGAMLVPWFALVTVLGLLAFLVGAVVGAVRSLAPSFRTASPGRPAVSTVAEHKASYVADVPAVAKRGASEDTETDVEPAAEVTRMALPRAGYWVSRHGTLIRDDGERRSGAIDLAELISEVNARRRRWFFGKTTSVDFELSEAVVASYEALSDASEALSKSIQAERYVRSEQVFETNERKRIAGASSVIDTSAIAIRRSLPRAIRSNVHPWALRESDWGLYFFPTLIVVDDGRALGAAEYSQVRITSNKAVRVASNDSPRAPGDAVVVGQTWAYAKIGGGRDRRKKDNIELDKYEMTDIQIALPASGALRFAFSRAESAAEWVIAFEKHCRELAGGGSAPSKGSVARQIIAGVLASMLDGNARREPTGLARDRVES